MDAWLDAESLVPGQKWQVEIPKAIRESDVVIVCLSERSVNKEGYIQKEIKFALDIADEKPEGTIFIIPARLEECKSSDRLSLYQWVDLFEDNGYQRLMRALRIRADNTGLTLHIKRSRLPKVNTQPSIVKGPPTPIEKPIEIKQEKPKSKKAIQAPKTFNKTIIGIAIFVVFVIAAVFGLPPLIGKFESTPTATSTKNLETLTPIFENHTPFASLTPTQSQTPTSMPSSTATFAPRSINWGGTRVSWSGQPISVDNANQLKEISNLQVGLLYSYYGYPNNIVISRDGKLIVYRLGAVIYIRQTEDGSIIRSLVHPHNIDCLDLSPDGSLLASVTGNREFRIWKMDDGSLLQNLSGQQPEINCPIAFSPDGSLLASMESRYESKSINIWRVSDWTVIKSLNDPNDSIVSFSNPIFSPDGTLLVGSTYSQNNTYNTYMWNVKDWTLAHVFQDTGYWPSFSPDNNLLASVGDETISIWRVADGSLIQTINNTSSLDLGFSGPVFFFPNGQILVTGLFRAYSGTQGFRLWRASDGIPVQDIILNEDIMGLILQRKVDSENRVT